MSRPRFLADENLRSQIVRGVRKAEPLVEFSTVHDHGLGGAGDDVILEFADRNRWIVVSHDAKTMPAAAYARNAQGLAFPGLIIATENKANRLVIDYLVALWASNDAKDLIDSVRYPK